MKQCLHGVGGCPTYGFFYSYDPWILGLCFFKAREMANGGVPVLT